jgi:hypothetical protein
VEATDASTTISSAEMVERQGRNLPDIIVEAEGVDRRDRDRPQPKLARTCPSKLRQRRERNYAGNHEFRSRAVRFRQSQLTGGRKRLASPSQILEPFYCYQ